MNWKVGQTVMVQSRTWANINKPGGCAKIIKVHTNRAYDNLADDEDSYIEGLDVKYVLGGTEKNLDPGIVAPYEVLERGGRSRRGRDFLMQDAAKETAETANRGRRKRGRPKDSGVKEKTNQTKQSSNQPALSNKSKPQMAAAPGKENKTKKEKRPKQQQRQPKQPSSRKSTATCSTPEPPRHARKKLPKRVTPIPKVVLVNTGNEAETVSPYWMDSIGTSSSSSSNNNSANNKSAIHKTTQKQSSAIRGLNFDEKISTDKSGVPPLPNALLPPKKSTLTLPSKAKSRKNINNSTLHPTSSNTGSNHHSKKRKQPPHTETHEPTFSSKKNKLGQSKDSAMATATKYSHSKPKPLQPPSSFSRTTSAYGSLPKNNRIATKSISNGEQPPKEKKPLLDVYRSEVEKAQRFMDEMVGGPRATSDDCGNDIGNSNDGKVMNSCSVPQISRYDEFLSHLHKVWIKIDDEEEISEDSFKRVYQEVSGGYFSQQELGTHLATLCQEGKEVVLSDGMLYRVC